MSSTTAATSNSFDSKTIFVIVAFSVGAFIIIVAIVLVIYIICYKRCRKNTAARQKPPSRDLVTHQGHRPSSNTFPLFWSDPHPGRPPEDATNWNGDDESTPNSSTSSGQLSSTESRLEESNTRPARRRVDDYAVVAPLHRESQLAAIHAIYLSPHDLGGDLERETVDTSRMQLNEEIRRHHDLTRIREGDSSSSPKSGSLRKTSWTNQSNFGTVNEGYEETESPTGIAGRNRNSYPGQLQQGLGLGVNQTVPPEDDNTYRAEVVKTVFYLSSVGTGLAATQSNTTSGPPPPIEPEVQLNGGTVRSQAIVGPRPPIKPRLNGGNKMAPMTPSIRSQHAIEPYSPQVHQPITVVSSLH